MSINPKSLTIKDYIYCETCKEYVDFWVHSGNIVSSGHQKCNWRYVTEQELKTCIDECIDSQCFERFV